MIKFPFLFREVMIEAYVIKMIVEERVGNGNTVTKSLGITLPLFEHFTSCFRFANTIPSRSMPS
jgi:hypothetical protein